MDNSPGFGSILLTIKGHPVFLDPDCHILPDYVLHILQSLWLERGVKTMDLREEGVRG